MLTDNSLSDTARVLGAYIASWGDELREVSPDEFARVAHGWPTPDTVSKHLRQLVIAGYIERESGGRDHANRYRFVATPPLTPGKKHCPINGHSFTPGKKPGSKSFTPGKKPGSKSPVVVVEEEGGEVEGDPPVVPPGVSPIAENAIANAGDVLAGCRGALRDYLRQRVPVDRQAGYVQTVVGWRRGLSPGVFHRPDGTSVPPEDQTAVLADALNDLAASDESRLKRPIGEPANLRTKISALLKRGQDGYRNGHSHAAAVATSGLDRGADGPARRASVGADDEDLSHLG